MYKLCCLQALQCSELCWNETGICKHTCSNSGGKKKSLHLRNRKWKKWTRTQNSTLKLCEYFSVPFVLNLTLTTFQAQQVRFILVQMWKLALLVPAAAGRARSRQKSPLCCPGLLCAMQARAHRWPLLFLRRPGWGRCEPEQWLHLGQAGGDWLHGRWGPLPALDPGQHSWPWRRHTTPPPGPPLLPRCSGPRGQHLQRPTLRTRRATDHPGAQRSSFRVWVGEPWTGPRLG